LLNLPKCTGCHGSDHTIRGVLSIQADMTPIFAQAEQNILFAVMIFLGIVFALFLILSLFLKRTVISPIQRVGFVADQVTNGNFQEKVAVKSHDEIGELGRKINTMVDGLYERFALSKYVSSSTIESIRNSEKGARKEIALLFSDIRGFTSFSEKLEPEAVVESLNKILNIQTEIIHRHGGDIDKYVGDEIVALFSGPGKELHACQAALEIQTYVLLYQDDLVGLNVGVGINTGEVILGRIGSERRADFTVIGDHVNFASRLCSQAKAGEVIISDSSYQNIHKQAEVSKPQEIKVKGKEKAQKVYRLTALRK
jgi:adenylate cyclase